MTIEIIKFWSKACGQCKAQEGILSTILAEHPSVKLTKYDIAEHPDLVEKHEIKSLPTLLILKDGQVTEKLVGLKPKALITKHLQP